MKQRWKRWNEAPENDQILADARKRGTKTLWQTMDNKKRNSNGHTLVFFKPDWPTLPARSDAKKTEKDLRRGRACTCTTCYRTALRGNLSKGKCTGTFDKIFQGTKNIWDRVQLSLITLDRLFAAWGMTKQKPSESSSTQVPC